MKNQTTIKKPVLIEGTGLFSGKRSTVRLLPAPVNTGVVFVKTDTPARPRIPLSPQTLVPKVRRTAVCNTEAEIETVEHLLSAIKGLEIDNIIIEVDAGEIPHLDGSSKTYVQEITNAGIEEQDEPKKVISIKEPIRISEGDAFIMAVPDDTFKISYTLYYPQAQLDVQYLCLEMTSSSYIQEIASARTYCFMQEAKAILQQGLGKGGDYQNVIVFENGSPVGTTLRFKDEPVRHKILDLIGDLACLNGLFHMHIIAIRSGHSQNIALVRKIAESIEVSDKRPAVPEPFFEIYEILETLPHRYPFLLIDKVIEMEGYERAVGLKNVTVNEPFFQGHYPQRPVMPGVLIVEAMAQLAGVMLLRRPDSQQYTPILLEIDNVKLRKTVVPGDQLIIKVKATKIKVRSAEVEGVATVNDVVVAEAKLKFILVEK